MRLPLPREHGAWAMLLTSLVLGQSLAGQVNLPSLILWLTALALFILRQPLSLLLRHPASQAPSEARVWTAVLSAVVMLGGTWLFWLRGTLLLVPALPAAFFFLLQLRYVRPGQRRTWQAEVLGTAGISLTAPAVLIAATGSLNYRELGLWLILFSYFAAGVVHVRWRLRAPQDSRQAALNLGLQVSLMLAAAAAGRTDLLPPAAFLAFLPGLCKVLLSLRQGQKKAPVKRVGWTEVLYSFAFFLLLLLAWSLAPAA